MGALPVTRTAPANCVKGPRSTKGRRWFLAGRGRESKAVRVGARNALDLVPKHWCLDGAASSSTEARSVCLRRREKGNILRLAGERLLQVVR